MGKAKQGKWAEGKVNDWLNKYKATRASFTFNRILDASSARGMMSNPQPGDYQWFMDTGLEIAGFDCPGQVVNTTLSEYLPYTRNGLIEVKSVEHMFRLPYANFNTDQVARMRLRALAGSETLVLVAFRPEAHKPYWRTAPLEYFEQREPGKGSWDMSNIDAYTLCDDLLEMHLK